MHRLAMLATAGVLVGATLVALEARASQPSTTLIRNAILIDGTGAAPRKGDVRVAGDRIVAVGTLAPVDGDQVIDAGGLALAPGLIDTHSHHDRGLTTGRDALAIADLVLFDPATVADRSDFGKAQEQAVGIHTVWVNGQIVFQDGKTTGNYSGRPLRRETPGRPR